MVGSRESDDFFPALNSVWAKTSWHRTMDCLIVETQVNISINTFWNWVDIDKSFATRWLVDHLALFGLSISSDEVTEYLSVFSPNAG